MITYDILANDHEMINSFSSSFVEIIKLRILCIILNITDGQPNLRTNGQIVVDKMRMGKDSFEAVRDMHYMWSVPFSLSTMILLSSINNVIYTLLGMSTQWKLFWCRWPKASYHSSIKVILVYNIIDFRPIVPIYQIHNAQIRSACTQLLIRFCDCNDHRSFFSDSERDFLLCLHRIPMKTDIVRTSECLIRARAAINDHRR